MPTMLCQLRCEVCHFKIEHNFEGYSFTAYDTKQDIKKELEWHEWLLYFNRFRPYHLELSGGEPTIYPGFKELINHLPPDATWAITSNTLSDSLEGIPFKQCKHWTASYHLGASKKVFTKNLYFLQEKVDLSVSIVVEFNNFEPCIDEALYFRKAGFKVNILRELNPGISWENTQQWNILLKMRDKGFNVVEDDIPSNYNFESGFSCLAGCDYFCAMPDGKVYDCYSNAMTARPYGHIKDIVLNLKIHDCFYPCLGCALDHKYRVKKLREVIKS
jgi:MoaA/NifB/PqqE/SkfB family radical SAM enzyme